MPTTSDVLDQSLKCFRENDLDGVVADYSSDAVLFVPGKPLKGPDAIKPCFQAFFTKLQSQARRFRCVSDTLTVNTLTFCGAQKQRTTRTRQLPTRSLCGTGKS
jgi:ketosteroid isomerase-like protein